MALFLVLLAFIILNLIYHLGWLTWAIIWGVHNDHYFFGFNPKLFDLEMFGIRISFGIYIPIIGLAKTYKIENGEKKRIDLAWEFYDRPLWKRSIVALGGVISLMITGILCFIATAYLQQEYFLSKETVNRYGIEPSETALKLGFQSGDRILKINNGDYQKFSELLEVKDRTTYAVDRQNSFIELTITREDMGKEASHGQPFFNLVIPPIVAEVTPSSPGEKAGLLKGDRFTKINGINVKTINDFKKVFATDTLGRIKVEIERIQNNSISLLNKTIDLDESGLIGFTTEFPNYSSYQRTFKESVIDGTQHAFNIIDLNVRAFYKMFSGNVAIRKPVSGPIGIAETYGSQNQWLRFWKLTGMIAMLTAFFNLLPLPRSVFWQTIPLAYEAITKEKFSYKTYRRLNVVGYFIVTFLMIAIIFGDLFVKM